MDRQSTKVKVLGLCLSVSVKRELDSHIICKLSEDTDPLWLKRQKSKSLRPRKK